MTMAADLVGIGTLCIGLATIGTLFWTIYQQTVLTRHSQDIKELKKDD
jgi:hypothetical protein